MGRPGFIPGPAGRGRGPGAEAVEVACLRAELYVNYGPSAITFRRTSDSGKGNPIIKVAITCEAFTSG